MKDGDSITQAASASELGKSYKAGLPNVTGYIEVSGSSLQQYSAGGAFSTALSANNGESYQANGKAIVYNMSLSAGNPIYGNSTTVTDEQVRLRHFVVLASAQNSASVFDWSNYMAGLAGKANLDMDNLTQVGTAAIAHCAMPSGRMINVTLPANNTQSIPAPADGLFRIYGNATGAGQVLGLWGAALDAKSAGANGNSLACSVPVRKGETVTVSYTIPVTAFQFIYAQGAY